MAKKLLRLAIAATIAFGTITSVTVPASAGPTTDRILTKLFWAPNVLENKVKRVKKAVVQKLVQ